MNCAGAHGLVQHVHSNGGLIEKNMASFFELRFGHAVHEAGIAIQYEVPGENDSTLDFGLSRKGSLARSK